MPAEPTTADADSAPLAEERFKAFLGNVLRIGVIVAGTVVLLGGGLYLVRHGQEQPHYAVFTGEPADLRQPSGIVSDALQLRARGIIQLGVLLLVATPVARVALSVVGFWKERDFLYVGFTVAALAGLLYSLFVGESF